MLTKVPAKQNNEHLVDKKWLDSWTRQNKPPSSC